MNQTERLKWELQGFEMLPLKIQLKHIMRVKGLSQRNVAELTKISRTVISQIMKGEICKTRIPYKVIQDFCENQKNCLTEEEFEMFGDPEELQELQLEYGYRHVKVVYNKENEERLNCKIAEMRAYAREMQRLHDTD